MRRVLQALLVSAALVPAGAPAALASGLPSRAACDDPGSLCAETVDNIGYNGTYIGHDEPSVLFYSNKPGSGNNQVYRLRLPKDPPTMPTQDGTGGTWNFQLHPAFWFGMAMCDTQSAPEYTNTCTPDSDLNIFNSARPKSAHYIGKHPGTAFMEMQFYPPGWVPWPPGVSCDGTHWCAALNVDSLSENQNIPQLNNADCLNKVGLEPVNFAFITKNGAATTPASPLNPARFSPDLGNDLLMSPGDIIVVSLHDTPDGLQVLINDRTTGASGSMTASPANGFAQVVYDPNATTCQAQPYAFHPEYATSSTKTRVPWAAHSYNVAYSDEIGHFEYCATVVEEGGDCASGNANDPGGLDDDDTACFSAALSTLVPIGGCIQSDADFDGPPYQKVWPGSTTNRTHEQLFDPEPIMFTAPTFDGGRNYSKVAFETDLPRIEAPDSGGICNRTTGENCVNPPPGAQFYPIYTTTMFRGKCWFQEGGANLPGTINDFGGNSAAEYGPLLQSVYPGGGFQPVYRYNNFRQILTDNPCAYHGQDVPAS